MRCVTATSKPASKASYKLALYIARDKILFNKAEELIVPYRKDVCFELLRESASNKISGVPSSKKHNQ
jgi:hypothetical protein